MKKKKVLKVFLIVFLSLILAIILSLAAIFQFVIKPHTEKIADSIEQVISDPEFIDELVQDENAEEILEENNLSDFLIEDIDGTNTSEQPPQTPKKPAEEYKNIYDYAKDNIDSNDLKTGMSFASRIDVKYILGLLKGGLTVPEKRELKAYLKKHFTNNEISQGISLYNKYSYLLK